MTYAPEEPAPQPTAEVTKDFMMSAGSLRLEASLDKEVLRIRIHCKIIIFCYLQLINFIIIVAVSFCFSKAFVIREAVLIL